MNPTYRIIIYGLNHHNKYFDDIAEMDTYTRELAKLRQTFQKQVHCGIHGWVSMMNNGKCFYCNYNGGLK